MRSIAENEAEVVPAFRQGGCDAQVRAVEVERKLVVREIVGSTPGKKIRSGFRPVFGIRSGYGLPPSVWTKLPRKLATPGGIDRSHPSRGDGAVPAAASAEIAHRSGSDDTAYLVEYGRTGSHVK